MTRTQRSMHPKAVFAAPITRSPCLRMRMGLALVGVMFISCAVAIHASADSTQRASRVTAQVERGSSPLAVLLPGMAHAPAPAWLKIGLRLTYQGAASSGIGGPAGGGYNVWEVTGLDGTTVAMSNADFISLDPGGAPSLHDVGALLGSPGACIDLWVNPTVLRRLKNRSAGGLMIYRAPFTAMGKQRSTVWIKTTGRNGATLYVYEEATGLLLHTASSGPGAETDANTSLSQSTLVGMRFVHTPWQQDFSAARIAAIPSVQFTGTTTTSVPAGFPITNGYSVSYKLKDHGPNWALFGGTAITHSSPALTTAGDVAVGPTSFGGLWIPPQDLALLRAGQELDRDPITQVIAAVDSVRHTREGSAVVVISVGNTMQRSAFGYDLTTGLLTYGNILQSVGPATIQISLQRSP